MFDHVQFTGTINLGAISTAILTLLGLAAVWARARINEEKTRRIIREENQRTRECIHKIPGHPQGRPPGARSRKSDIIAGPIVSRETPPGAPPDPPGD